MFITGFQLGLIVGLLIMFMTAIFYPQLEGLVNWIQRKVSK